VAVLLDGEKIGVTFHIATYICIFGSLDRFVSLDRIVCLSPRFPAFLTHYAATRILSLALRFGFGISMGLRVWISASRHRLRCRA